MEVKKRYGCKQHQRCASCKDRGNCNKYEAGEYRQYNEMKRRELKERYKCDVIGTLCRLDRCDDYSSCTRAAKKNFLAWKKAYNNNRKKELERLSKGGR